MVKIYTWGEGDVHFTILEEDFSAYIIINSILYTKNIGTTEDFENNVIKF